MKKRILRIALIACPLLFYSLFSFRAGNYVPFSNDGPLGALQANRSLHNYQYVTWDDLNWLGSEGLTSVPGSISYFLRASLQLCVQIRKNGPPMPILFPILAVAILFAWRMADKYPVESDPNLDSWPTSIWNAAKELPWLPVVPFLLLWLMLKSNAERQ